MIRRQFMQALLPSVAAWQPPAPPQRRDVAKNVRDFGAVGDGAKMNTRSIQAAIDACSGAGGGTLVFPPGRYLTGTIFLKNNVALSLERGATLLGSTNLADYPVIPTGYHSYTDNYTEKSLIYAENAENVALEGHGTIDGQGAAFKGPYKVRPYLIRFVTCRRVAVTDLKVVNSPMWVHHFLACEDVNLRGVTIHSQVNSNNDGFDIDSCDRVTISDCNITSGDDAIVFKSTSDRVCRNVVVSNCVLSTHCNALKWGTESNGGFQNIAVSNCVVHDTRLSGIALEMVDGGVMDGINVSNITMQNTRCPIFLRLGNRARPFPGGNPKPGMGRMRNIILSNVQATGADRFGCVISGIPGHLIEHVTLDNIRLRSAGGGTREEAERKPPENETGYPEYKMFGVLPAHGFYCRHVRDIRFSSVQVSTELPDERPGLVCEDASDVKLINSEFGRVVGV